MSRREKMEAMLQDSPDDLFLNYAYAMELVKESKIEEAQASFRKVRKLDPNHVPAYFQEGQMLAAAERIEESRQILQEGITVARQTDDEHALGEMTEFLATL